MRRKVFSKKFLFVLYILIIVLILLIFIDTKFWQYLDKKEIKVIPLVDKCSSLFNNIIHSIKDEASCENYCRAECSTRNMKFHDSEFSLNPEGCNSCNCHCK